MEWIFCCVLCTVVDVYRVCDIICNRPLLSMIDLRNLGDHARIVPRYCTVYRVTVVVLLWLLLFVRVLNYVSHRSLNLGSLKFLELGRTKARTLVNLSSFDFVLLQF
jgi:hypothetical protein